MPDGARRWLASSPARRDQWQKHFPRLHFNLDGAAFSYILEEEGEEGREEQRVQEVRRQPVG